MWKTYMNPVGGVDPLLEQGKRFEAGDYVTEEVGGRPRLWSFSLN